jgi:hypothetical protein
MPGRAWLPRVACRVDRRPRCHTVSTRVPRRKRIFGLIVAPREAERIAGGDTPIRIPGARRRLPAPGDLLVLRESWRRCPCGVLHYRTPGDEAGRWHSGASLPMRLCRLWLEVRAVDYWEGRSVPLAHLVIDFVRVPPLPSRQLELFALPELRCVCSR